MQGFIEKYASIVTGVLSGFDRIVFRGTLRQLCYVEGMKSYLAAQRVLLKDFGTHVQAMSEALQAASLAVVLAAKRPVIYLESSKPRKELIARKIMEEDGLTKGPICTLRCVEPCLSYDIFRNRETQRLELRQRQRKCLHLYHYFIHPVFGFMHARVQTWFPFTIQLCLNGREWLARQMDDQELGYQRKDNAFVWLSDPDAAQALLRAQLDTHWPDLFGQIAQRVNPAHAAMFEPLSLPYYWTAHQTEWATDVVFKRPSDLAAIYPRLIQHGIRTFGSTDILRFLGKHVPIHGNVHGQFLGEINSDVKTRPEGVRIKHRQGQNSLKLYDKHGQILRVECTINDPSSFKVYRATEGGNETDKDWRTMRRGVADLHQRAKVSHQATVRYMEALTDADTDQTLADVTDPLCKRIRFHGRSVRGFNPSSTDDIALLKAIRPATFAISGFRNRDLRAALYTKPATDLVEERRRSACVTRKLRLLRAHGLIRKINKTHRYQVTTKGRKALAVILAARDANAESLMKLAA